MANEKILQKACTCILETNHFYVHILDTNKNLIKYTINFYAISFLSVLKKIPIGSVIDTKSF